MLGPQSKVGEPVAMRRLVAWTVAVVLFVEALGVAALNWLLGIVVDRQHMSLAGLDPDMMSSSSKIGGIVFGLCFALCGLVALLVGLRDRAPVGFGRVLLISAAVVHGLLGALSWGLAGPLAFLFMVLVLALIVLLLMTYDSPGEPAPDDAPPPSGMSPDGTSADGGRGSGGSPVIPPPAPSTP
ncbi:hypothetical protein M2271_002703 [Streptomyces sp. LBL]|uniref:hypothetical protein n=1 Tax=Streptomyces sp. LBL TaxID=2940562 RepID=UPI0024749AA8|nr:hypothetical protein [Streptomyces sp. LBL]MDH6624899.1 hypothetical protein [Streptomyces sp. LBL]